MNELKFLIVGLGSMGKRRIRNLKQLKIAGIIGFDPRSDRCEEANTKYGVKTYQDFEKAMAEAPDALIISTPPDLHIKYGLIAAKQNKHFFMEASVVDDGMDELIKVCRNKNIVAAPSCTMRFYPAIKLMKQQVAKNEVGKILAFTYHSGMYLPDWHKYEDYRNFYASKKATGAGREIVPFELVWLTWVLGDIKKVSCIKGKISDMDCDIDDVYYVLMEMESGALGSILVDAVSRVPHRILRLMGSEGEIFWDWSDKRVRLFKVNDNKWREFPVEEGVPQPGYIYGEEMYVEEISHFINAIQGKEIYSYSLSDDKRVLELLYTAETSSEKGRHEQISKQRR